MYIHIHMRVIEYQAQQVGLNDRESQLNGPDGNAWL